MATHNLNLGPHVCGARSYSISLIAPLACHSDLPALVSLSLILELEEYIITPDPYQCLLRCVVTKQANKAELFSVHKIGQSTIV